MKFGEFRRKLGQGPDRNPSADRYGPSNNAPLRGRKCEPWDGGTRTMALVSGGFIAPPLRGTSSDVLMHVADWFVSNIGAAPILLAPSGLRSQDTSDVVAHRPR